jgi:hypothetical protein
MFDPNVTVPENQAGTVWGEEDYAPHTGTPNLAQVPFSHWFDGLPAVQSNVPYGEAQQAFQDRMLTDHSQVNYVPDSVRLYQHVSEGVEIDFVTGRGSAYAGVDPGENLQYLVNGTNA